MEQVNTNKKEKIINVDDEAREAIKAFFSDEEKDLDKKLAEIKEIHNPQTKRDIWEKMLEDKEFNKFWDTAKILLNEERREEIYDVFKTEKVLESSY
ncbi:MAG TPA: hypothetical protein VMR49_01080 [Candidatus Paceibacterota bacterium]|jgi:hypothetical protein|nr:hypothetical protein [Candidatus Paceibacterota bacterium]